MARGKRVENQRPTAKPLPGIGPSGARAHNALAMISFRSRRLAPKPRKYASFCTRLSRAQRGWPISGSPLACLFQTVVDENFGRPLRRRAAHATGGRSRGVAQLAQLALVRYPLGRIRRPRNGEQIFCWVYVARDLRLNVEKCTSCLKEWSLTPMRLFETRETSSP